MKKIEAIAPGESGKMIRRGIYRDVASLLLPLTKRPIVADGGACMGKVTNVFLKIWPKSIIYAFEARPNFATRLEKKYKKRTNVKVYNRALSNKDSVVKFNLTKKAGTGSVLPPSKRCEEYHGKAAHVVKTVKVKSIRLDTFLDKLDYLKMDIEGSELPALKGCTGLFDTLKVITSEVMFYRAYVGQPLFWDINVFLGANGFQLFSLYNLGIRRDGRMGSGDALYINNRFYNNIVGDRNG